MLISNPFNEIKGKAKAKKTKTTWKKWENKEKNKIQVKHNFPRNSVEQSSYQLPFCLRLK